MQYQVIEKETGKIIAWIDSGEDKAITLDGYTVKCGPDLRCEGPDLAHMLTSDTITSDVKVGKFERVSYEQYLNDCDETTVTNFNTAIHSYADIRIPIRKTHESAGYDFFAPHGFTIHAGETVKIPTGIKVKLSSGYYLSIVPRSSLGVKFKLTLDNTVGVIDADYYDNPSNEGHIFLFLTNHSHRDLDIKQGDSIVQGIIHRYYVTDNDKDFHKDSREGGYGSTGR